MVAIDAARAAVRRRHLHAHRLRVAGRGGQPQGERFYDEGGDFWPKRYAIWGRLVAQQPGQIGYSIIDSKAIGRFMPPVFPGVKADTCPSWRKAGFARGPPSPARSMPFTTPPAAWASLTTPRWTTATRRRHARQNALGPPHRHRPVLRLRAQAGRHLHLPGLQTDDTAAVRFNNQPSPNLFVAGEMMAATCWARGYTAGVGMSIGTAFGRIAGNAANAALEAKQPKARSIKRKQLQKQEQTMQALEAPDARRQRRWRMGEIVLSAPRPVARQLQICNACRYCEGFAPCSPP